jgi:hypothetical protein
MKPTFLFKKSARLVFIKIDYYFFAKTPLSPLVRGERTPFTCEQLRK